MAAVASEPNVTIQDNSEQGIYLQQAGEARITNASITGNGGDGILADGNSYLQVAANRIEANGGDGIHVTSRATADLAVSSINQPPNTTDPDAPNGGYGVHCESGGYVAGSLGNLTGTSGVKLADGTCQDFIQP